MADVERNRRKAVFDTHPSLTAFFLPEEKDAHLHFFLSDPREIIQVFSLFYSLETHTLTIFFQGPEIP